MQLTASDGESRIIGAGEVILVEDTTGKGHLSKAINERVSPCGTYLDAAHLYNSLQSPAPLAIADRKVARVKSLEELESALSATKQPELLVIENSEAAELALRTYLVENYSRNEVFGYSLFTFNGSRSNTLVEAPTISTQTQISFKGTIEHLGFNYSISRGKPYQTISLLDRYLNRHVHLMPSFLATVEIEHYWRIPRQLVEDLKFTTELESIDHPDYRITADYPGLDKLYPTSSWPIDRIIRDDFKLVIPRDAPPGRYRLLIGVAPPGGSPLLVDSQTVTFGAGLVVAGEIVI